MHHLLPIAIWPLAAATLIGCAGISASPVSTGDCLIASGYDGRGESQIVDPKRDYAAPLPMLIEGGLKLCGGVARPPLVVPPCAAFGAGDPLLYRTEAIEEAVVRWAVRENGTLDVVVQDPRQPHCPFVLIVAETIPDRYMEQWREGRVELRSEFVQGPDVADREQLARVSNSLERRLPAIRWRDEKGRDAFRASTNGEGSEYVNCIREYHDDATASSLHVAGCGSRPTSVGMVLSLPGAGELHVAGQIVFSRIYEPKQGSVFDIWVYYSAP